MYDKEFKGKVTVEDTLQLLYVRYGRERLDEEIQAIFGEEKTDEGNEKQIEYREYIDKINHRAMEERRKRKQEMKELWAKKHGMQSLGEEDSRM